MAKTLKTVLAEARTLIPEQGPAEVQRRLEAGEPVVLIDVRDPDEYREGFIEPATNISRGFLEFRVAGVAKEPETPIVLYCQTGLRSMLAARALSELGYTNVTNLQGGFQKWAQAGFPVVKDKAMGPEQIQRYSRHFLLDEVGEKGQRKLLRSKVLLIGAGGLGSPTALYLAAAGVGTIGLMDADVVDLSNLQRQVLHTTADIGKPKVESGARTLTALNPDVNVIRAARAHHRGQRARHRQRVRRHRGWLRQLRDALPRQRRLLPGGQAARARLDLPVRGDGLRVRAATRARATAASIRHRRRRASCPPARRRACSACCRGSWAWCRPRRRSSSCSASATR